MQHLDISKMHDMLSRYFSTELKNTIPDCDYMLSQAEDRTAIVQVILPKDIDPETIVQKITVAVSRYMKTYITDIMQTDVGDVNRNVTFYETEVKNNIIFFKWMF